MLWQQLVNKNQLAANSKWTFFLLHFIMYGELNNKTDFCFCYFIFFSIKKNTYYAKYLLILLRFFFLSHVVYFRTLYSIFVVRINVSVSVFVCLYFFFIFFFSHQFESLRCKRFINIVHTISTPNALQIKKDRCPFTVTKILFCTRHLFDIHMGTLPTLTIDVSDHFPLKRKNKHVQKYTFENE